MRKLLLLRPEPGLSASRRRAQQLGLETVESPLFEFEPMAWSVMHPASFDALLLTSAQAPRLAGPGLDHFRHLPVYAVGKATAAAARDAGLKVAVVGEGGVDELVAEIPGSLRLLHLAGEDRHAPLGQRDITGVAVYRARPVESPRLPPVGDFVVAVHSPRAGERLAELVQVRSNTSIAAISTAAADACGKGWRSVEMAVEPSDEALLALAARLCNSPDR